jgi:hypothetical protein
MSEFLKNIGRFAVVGFLLFSVSGFTIAIHHEHVIGNNLAEHVHNHDGGPVVNPTPSTFHEIHFVKLLSGDSFNGSTKIELKTSLVELFTIHLDRGEYSPIHPSISLASTDVKETGSPSVDRCVLFCSFLI